MLRSIREALRDDVVDGGFDRLAEAEDGTPTIMTGKGARLATVFSAAPSPRSVRIAGWRPRASSRSSASATFSSSPTRMSIVSQRPGHRAGILRHPQMQREGHELLLGSVVEVAFESPSLREGCVSDPRTRGGQLVVGLRALERECDQLREVAQALLCVRVNGSPMDRTKSAPQVRPPAMIGDATEDWYPASRIILAASPGTSV